MPTRSLIDANGPTSNAVDAIDLMESGAGEIAALRLAPDADLTEILEALPRVQSIFIDFPAFTDGRGFSLARLLRKRHGYDGLLVADGQLIPDQFAFALQCGFDAVRISDEEMERHTPEAWDEALSDFDLTYQRGYAVAKGPAINIFDARLTALEAGRSADPFSA